MADPWTGTGRVTTESAEAIKQLLADRIDTIEVGMFLDIDQFLIELANDISRIVNPTDSQLSLSFARA